MAEFDQDEDLITAHDDEGDTLEATWWVFDEPSIKNLMDIGEESIQDVLDKFELKPVVVDDKYKIFQARYELVKYGEELQYPDAKLKDVDDPIGWADFLGGLPYGAVEIMALVYGKSTEKYPTDGGNGDPVPPIPDDLFDGYEANDTPYNTLYIEEDWCDGFSDGVEGELESPRWWQRINFTLPDDPEKRPTPGEFVALGIRVFPTKPWGDQESSPFLSSGNWFDTLYYTSAKVVEILEPEGNRPFKLYKVKWRATEKGGETEFLARPSGFEEYEVDDLVAILKDAATERKSQTWKDDQEFDQEVWRIVPITFYKKDEGEGE